MATTVHETPEWETPTPKQSFLSKYNIFSKPESTLPTTKEGSSDSSGNAAATGTFGKPTLTERFNDVLPANRTYFGRSRKVLLLIVGAIVLLLALVLGLGLGLGLKHSSSKALPLPSNGGIFTGDLTYYAPGLGACGITSSSSESICAVSHIIFDAASTSSNPNANPLCGKKIRITRQKDSGGGNSTVDVTVVDRCVGCKAEDLDLSITVFEKLALEAEGRVTGSWAWL
ncbi:putative riboflavin aldehyde-forming enzyme protein [Botrytis fragariae]|uniref:Putative riboflavin aldehyde-forming enzyme protein n=1 Tax=Botrytis fragariae TaxID=1964551 RepID=A0A8H6AQH2_9HELO|nr:putative riboflavin aldehyde-forming enzyme protein [Botrytis fragariae]KAF5871716.1 putative riboflavin aldehyde-forming enzyme protein [Botrytis fragariae]